MAIYGSFVSNNSIDENLDYSIFNEVDDLLNDTAGLWALSEFDVMGYDPFESYMLESSLDLDIEYVNEGFGEKLKSIAGRIKQFFVDLGKRIVGGFKHIIERIRGIFTKNKSKGSSSSSSNEGKFPINISGESAEKLYICDDVGCKKLLSWSRLTNVESQKRLTEEKVEQLLNQANNTMIGQQDVLDKIELKIQSNYDMTKKFADKMLGQIAEIDKSFADSRKYKVDETDYKKATLIVKDSSNITAVVKGCEEAIKGIDKVVAAGTKKAKELEDAINKDIDKQQRWIKLGKNQNRRIYSRNDELQKDDSLSQDDKDYINQRANYATAMNREFNAEKRQTINAHTAVNKVISGISKNTIAVGKAVSSIYSALITALNHQISSANSITNLASKVNS